ncbi:MAG: hypothetical protein AAF892_12440 [Cyanobacteria bacterium P01_D01_bin.71]
MIFFKVAIAALLPQHKVLDVGNSRTPSRLLARTGLIREEIVG